MSANQRNHQKRIKLCIEGDKAPFWGHVEYDNNLLVEEADSIASLQSKMQTLLKYFHELDNSAYKFQIEFVDPI